jgi:hypothetical protein
MPQINVEGRSNKEIQRLAYKRFSRIISRLVAETGMDYCWTAEIQEKSRQMIHYHMLCNPVYLDFKALSAMWEKMNGATAFNNSVHGEVVQLDNSFDLVGYMTKSKTTAVATYLSKGSTLPIYGRIYGSSQNLVKNVVLSKQKVIDLLENHSLQLYNLMTADNYNVLYGKYYGNFVELAKLYNTFDRNKNE